MLVKSWQGSCRVWALPLAVVGTVLLVLVSAARIYRDDRYKLTTSSLHSSGRVSVRAGCTLYQGLEHAGVEFFGGMRYAMSPVGKRRFAPSEPYVDCSTPDNGKATVVDATGWGKFCMQRPTSKRPRSKLSEDCLTLNVIRPAQRYIVSPLPTMVWIYGSGFQSGAPAMYNGTAIVQRSIELGTPIIFVSMDYRLGAWSQPDELALGDQALALDWIRANLQAFGGDKNLVTLAGQSSGAMSIWHHVVRAPSSAEIWWRGVIAASGAIDSFPLYPSGAREPYFRAFARLAGCSHPDLAQLLDCLRRVDDTQTVLDAYLSVMEAANELVSGNHTSQNANLVDVGVYGRFPWMPSAPSVPDDWERRLRANMAGRPALVGTTLDEGYSMLPDDVDTEAALLSLLARTFNSSRRAERLWEVYDGAPRGRAARILGDVIYQAPVRATARALDAYYYLYSYRNTPGPVIHGEELCALFRPLECGIGHVVVDRWVNFVVAGHPGDSRWRPYPSALRLDANPRGIPLWRVTQIQAAENALRDMHTDWRPARGTNSNMPPA